MPPKVRAIQPDKWYIIDLLRLDIHRRPKLIKKPFDNVKQIKMNLDEHFPRNLRFDWIKGKKAIELGLKISTLCPNLNIYLRKYYYRNYMITPQDRKSYRTKFRRHNRTKKGEYYRKWG